MDGIVLMIDEHKKIKRMLDVIRKVCRDIMNGAEIEFKDFENIIDFVRNYADKHHHGKEEKFLFTKMVDEIGGAAEKLVKFGMLVEHDFGRMYIRDLEEALEKYKSGNEEAKLDIVANAVSYANLLFRHIDREDNVAYSFAKRELCKDTLSKIDIECEEFEIEAHKEGLQDRYIKVLEMLEKKYNEV